MESKNKDDESIRAAARTFAQRWKEHGDEKQDTHTFWLELLRDVCGAKDAGSLIKFEVRVKVKNVCYIDAMIESTRTLIEQKGSAVDLDRAERQSDGASLTPFEQALRYANRLPFDKKPRWIIVCNFAELRIHDMNAASPASAPQIVRLHELETEYWRLGFLVDAQKNARPREEDVSIEAGRLVGRLYDALSSEYRTEDGIPYGSSSEFDKHSTGAQKKSLNILCVRIVFCFYAEDAGLFPTHTAFEDYIKSFPIAGERKALIDLFRALDTPLDSRDVYDTQTAPFPYVNGGLFRDTDAPIEVPGFTEGIAGVIADECALFDWSGISPTIFGAVFEATLNPQTRRSGGMHYTSPANILRALGPLFLDALESEAEALERLPDNHARIKKAASFQNKLSSIQILDPACGSGNFLTQAYISLRRLENRALRIMMAGERTLGGDFSPVKVSIAQMKGIEINDFAVAVAKTALWIAESQMLIETEDITGHDMSDFPLRTGALIIEGDALELDWETLEGASTAEPMLSLFEEQEKKKRSGKKYRYDYIVGNPPFSGARFMTSGQKRVLLDTLGALWPNAGELDYVSGWYVKAARLMQRQNIRTALVATSSITQGEQAAYLWKVLKERYNVHIDFAWRPFRWENENKVGMARVHCVIIGFSCAKTAGAQAERIIFDGVHRHKANNINGYLLDAPDVFIESRSKPLCNVPEMLFGSMPNDGHGNLSGYTDEQKNAITQKYPQTAPLFRRFMGAEEFINGLVRWCLWLADISPALIKRTPPVYKAVKAVKEARKKSVRESTRHLADIPSLFGEIRQPKEGDYILVPSTSSENREYIPIGFLHSDTIASNATLIVPNAALWHFGVLASSVHNAWTRAVCGRLRNDYRYSVSVVYNNFPWPAAIMDGADEAMRARIEAAAKGVLEARAAFPEASLADLYGEASMPPSLAKAHRALDRAVIAAYGFPADISEAETVSRLMEMHRALLSALQ